MAFLSPLPMASGSAREPRSGPWTMSHTYSLMGSIPRASARIQSAPAGIFSMRSPYPVAVRRLGAWQTTSLSATRPAGPGHERVILNPSREMEAPKAANPSTEAAVHTFMYGRPSSPEASLAMSLSVPDPIEHTIVFSRGAMWSRRISTFSYPAYRVGFPGKM